MLVLQSDLYGRDADVREAVDDVLATAQTPTKEPACPGCAHLRSVVADQGRQAVLRQGELEGALAATWGRLSTEEQVERLKTLRRSCHHFDDGVCLGCVSAWRGDEARAVLAARAPRTPEEKG